MSLPIRWNPLHLDASIESDPVRTLGRFIARQCLSSMDMRPNINENDRDFIVQIDMPGLKKEEIDVSVVVNRITIRTSIKRELPPGEGSEACTDRGSRQAYRSFALPSDIDSARAQVSYDGSVLTLTVPKKSVSVTDYLSLGQGLPAMNYS
jgi:HSP20 family protein